MKTSHLYTRMLTLALIGFAWGNFAAQAEDSPNFRVDPHHNNLWGHAWPTGAELTVTIGNPAAPDWEGTTHVNEWGDFHLDVRGFNIQAGHQVTVTDGVTTKEHIVTSLTITDVNPDTDTISGTAAPDSWVSVSVHDVHVYRHVQANEHGDWTADFSKDPGDYGAGTYNLDAGSEGNAHQQDEDGDGTFVNWRVKQPYFNVDPQSNHLWGHEWPANDIVTIKQGDPSEIIGTADTDEWGNFWLDSPGDIQPGDLWQVECGDILKTHVVTELTVTVVDPDNDTVSGTAAPESWVSVHVFGADVHRHVKADEHGDWIADFSVAVGPEPREDAHDIMAGDNGNAQQEDEDRDSTFVNWRVDQPNFNVDPHHNNLWGHEWPAGAELAVTIGSPSDPDWEDSTHANEWGDFDLDVRGFNIQAGDLVSVTDSITIKEHIVTYLTITEVNPDDDTISGTAAPDSWIFVDVFDEHVYRDVQADGDGYWTADFSVVAGGHGGGIYNLDVGSEGNAHQRDDDGDATFVNWHIADPILVVDIFYNNIRGRRWSSGAEVIVAIGDPEAPDYVKTVHANAGGDWWVHLPDEDHLLQPGDMITADDGTYQRSMTVANLSVTGADPDADTLSGTGPTNAYVLVRVGEITVEALADQDGEWTADLGAEGVDIQEGTEGELFFYDEQGNVTQTRWRYATLHIHELSMSKLSFEDEFHLFVLEMEVDGLLGARFQAPSEAWYTLVREWDEWWSFGKHDSSMDEIEAEFGPGEYRLELTHYHGVTEVTLELSADMEMPNATPVITAPERRRSDVDPVDVEFVWESVENPNFNAVGLWIEDEMFGWEGEEDWYESFLPFDDEMPTQHTIGELNPDRFYFADVVFINMDEKITSGDLEVDYSVLCLTAGGTVFSTNTDEMLFDPIERVDISRGYEGGDEWRFEFEIEFSEALQTPGASPLYYRLELLTPDDGYYTLFDSHHQNEFGDLVELDIVRDDLDDLPGIGWYALIVQKDDESAVATWFLFAEPESEDPLPMPEQTPVITQPPPNTVLTNPVTFAWEPVTDEIVNRVAVFHAPEGFALLDDDAVEYSPPQDLPVGQQFVGVAFGKAYLDLSNADAIPYGIVQYRSAATDFTIGCILVYEAGPGGWMEGPVLQVVAPGGSGEQVAAFPEDGAVFLQWCDGHANAERTDDGVAGDFHVTASFSSEGGVPIAWYGGYEIAPEGEEDWSDVDQRYDPDKRMTLSQQYVADLDPSDPASIFRIVGIEYGPPITVHFEPSSTGRMYRLQYTDDLTSGEWDDIEGQSPRHGTGSDADFMEDEGAEAIRFYEIKVELP